jgi:hypothetical protein
MGLPAVLLRGGKSGAFVLGRTFVVSISFCTKFELKCFQFHNERKAPKRYAKCQTAPIDRYC